MMEAQYVCSTAGGYEYHAIRGGEWNYDGKNFTACGRKAHSVSHLDSGSPVGITCKRCQVAGPHWIVYLHNKMGGGSFDLAQVDSLRDAKEALRQYGKATSAYEQTSASLYPWSPEDWAGAQDYVEVGCPFDYPSYVIEWGPKGGLKVEKC